MLTVPGEVNLSLTIEWERVLTGEVKELRPRAVELLTDLARMVWEDGRRWDRIELTLTRNRQEQVVVWARISQGTYTFQTWILGEVITGVAVPVFVAQMCAAGFDRVQASWREEKTEVGNTWAIQG